MTVADGLRARLQGGRILLGGHRGNADELPESTLAGLTSALELGVAVMECDVHLAADGSLPVIHDHLLDRTTNGSGLVRDLTMAELKQLDAGSWKGAAFAGERIPALAEVLPLARARAGVAIEMKNLPLAYPGLERAAAAAADATGMTQDTAVVSFDHRSIARV